jgi:Kelch motif
VPSAVTLLGDWTRLQGPARRAHGLQFLAPVVAAGRVVVISGVDYDQATVKAIVFDARSRRWSFAAPSHVWWRSGTAVGAGKQVIMWGGCCGGGGRGSMAPGVTYDVRHDRWDPLAQGPLGHRSGHSAVWTGEEMIVWGGVSGRLGVDRPEELRADGAAYDPRSGTWRHIAPAPLSPRSGHVAVGTGDEMLVWGGSRPLRPLRSEHERPLYDGAAYDPGSDTWRRLPPTRLLAPPPPVLDVVPADVSAVWTGDTMLIWGTNGGASYDPDSDQWERVKNPPPDLGVAYDGNTAVWTGNEMIVWGGVHATTSADVATGAAYDPQRKAWRRLPEAPISGRSHYAALWTGEGMLVWGGCCPYYADGAIYTPDG